MHVVRLLAAIFLAVYLILSGLLTVSGMGRSTFARGLLDLIAIAAGVLILVSL